jgi:hypothetical protein
MRYRASPMARRLATAANAPTTLSVTTFLSVIL